MAPAGFHARRAAVREGHTTMRFMIIQKSDKNSAAGLPSDDLLAALGRRDEELPKGGVTRSGEALRLTSKGARVVFSGGRPSVIDEPFTEAKGLVAGFAMIDAASKEEAVDYVKGSPALHGAGDVEVEVREAGCPGGVAGVRPSSPPGSSAPAPGAGGADLPQFAILLKATEHTEAGFVANEQVLAAMSRRNEEAVRAGVLLAGEGLKPSSRGARVRLSRGNLAVLDGPFAEAKELIAGFWLIQVKSREEAIEWVKSYPYPLGPDGEGEVDIREVRSALLTDTSVR
jgi:hypothetical protein